MDTATYADRLRQSNMVTPDSFFQAIATVAAGVHAGNPNMGAKAAAERAVDTLLFACLTIGWIESK